MAEAEAEHREQLILEGKIVPTFRVGGMFVPRIIVGMWQVGGIPGVGAHVVHAPLRCGVPLSTPCDGAV